MTTRRTMLQRLSLIGATLVLPFKFAACSLSDVFNQIKTYVPIGLQAFSAILNILGMTGVIPPGGGTALTLIINMVKAGFADIVQAIQDYKTADTSQKPTLAGHLNALLITLEDHLQAFWNDLSIPDPALAATITALLGVLTSTLSGFSNLLPQPTQVVVRKPLSKRITVPAQARTIKEFKAEFNSRLPAQFAQYALR